MYAVGFLVLVHICLAHGTVQQSRGELLGREEGTEVPA
jgi:hypothetical protein